MSTGPCTPAPALLGNLSAVKNPCALLDNLYSAYLALSGGQQTAEIRDGNRTIRFHSGNTQALTQAIKALEHRCPGKSLDLFPRPMAVRAGPYTNIPGLHGGITRPRRY